MLAVDQQPVESGPGQQLGAVAAGQPQPQANPRTTRFKASLKALFIMFLLDKPAADRAHVAVVDVEGSRLARRYWRVKEPPRIILPGLQLDVVRRSLFASQATPLAG